MLSRKLLGVWRSARPPHVNWQIWARRAAALRLAQGENLEIDIHKHETIAFQHCLYCDIHGRFVAPIFPAHEQVVRAIAATYMMLQGVIPLARVVFFCPHNSHMFGIRSVVTMTVFRCWTR